jgi:hypothetical protein
VQWRIRVADIAIARGAPHGPRTGKGINKKTHTETLYILILTKPEAAVRASTPGEPLARAAAGATEKLLEVIRESDGFRFNYKFR